MSVPIQNLQAGHFLLPGAITSAIATFVSFAYMCYVWLRNFGPRAKRTG